MTATAAASALESGSLPTLALSEIRDARDPFAASLDVVLRQVGARSGHLYTWEDSRLRLACAAHSDASLVRAEAQLAALLARAAFAGDESTAITRSASEALADYADEDAETAFISSAPPPADTDSVQSIVLQTSAAAGSRVVGGLLLKMVPSKRTLLSPRFLDSIAEALYERVTSRFDSARHGGE
jgi:hypothetical protein